MRLRTYLRFLTLLPLFTCSRWWKFSIQRDPFTALCNRTLGEAPRPLEDTWRIDVLGGVFAMTRCYRGSIIPVRKED